MNSFVPIFGAPVQSNKDQGRKFDSKSFRLCDLLHIERLKSTSQTPHVNRNVERFNRTLTGIFKTTIKHWDEFLSQFLMVYNSSIHSFSRQTLIMMMLGRNITLPIEVLPSLTIKAVCNSLEF